MSLLNLRSEFPALNQSINGHSLVYLDNAATTLKPKAVIERINQYYASGTANVHRGAHTLSRNATDAFEHSRELCQKLVNARTSDEIIFTRGTTESINLVAHGLSETLVEGDEIIISSMEHHSNIVPWRMLADQKGLILKVIPLTPEGVLDLTAYEKLITSRTKLVAVVAMSNTLGILNPIEKILAKAREFGASTLVDAAQSISHVKTDVQQLDCDFLVFSGHKLFGPTGIGVLYAKKKFLDQWSPYQGGGAMISEVTFEKVTYNVAPFKFEAGTPHIAGVLGLAAAIEWFSQIGFEAIHDHYLSLSKPIIDAFGAENDVEFYGPLVAGRSIFSFNLKGAHSSDVGHLMDKYGVAIRVGHHCTQPLWRLFGTTAAARASFSLYNNFDDVDAFFESLKKVKGLVL